MYSGADANLQLEGFFREIASPLLHDVKFTYVGKDVQTDSLTEVDMKLFFKVQNGEE